jgi:hypothetical protein
MIPIFKPSYILLLSHNPCELFTHFDVDEMHGLSLEECKAYNNTREDSYISGLSNVVPNSNKRFVFINLSRCNGGIQTMGLVMHEMMHHSFWLHNYDMDKEEEIITWAEEETYEVLKTIEKYSREKLALE